VIAQITQRGGKALAAGEEVLVDAQYGGTLPWMLLGKLPG